MTDQPDLSTLPQRMRYASTVIEEAAREYHRRDPQGGWLARNWRSTDLVSYADLWERVDREADLRKLDELGGIIAEHFRALGVSGYNVAARGAARKAIDAGWTNEPGETVA